MSKYKCVRQHDIEDCAAASIATVCLQYKKETTITRLRDMSGTDVKGANAVGIVKALEKLGFAAKSGSITFQDLTNSEFKSKLTLPIIAQIQTETGLVHFVVIHKIYKNKLLVADPAKGLVKVAFGEFENDFLGNIILCSPTTDFIAGKLKTGSVFNRFFKLLLAQKKLFALAITGSIILTVLGIASSFFNKILMDEILPYNLKNQLFIFCIGFGIIGLFNLLLGSARQHLLLHLSLKIDIPLMLGYFKHIFSLPMKFFGARRTGDILTRFSDAGTIKQIFTTITLSLIIDVLLAIISGIILFIMNKTLFAIIAVITLLNIVLVYIFKKPYKELNLQSMEKSAALNSQIIDGLKSVETVKSFGIEADTLDKIESKFVQSLRVGYKANVTQNIQGFVGGFFGNIGNLVLMGIAALLVMNNDITLGSMFAFMSLSSYFMDPLGRLVGLQMQIQEAQIAMKRMAELYDIEPEQAEEQGLDTDFSLAGDITFENVTFGYGSRAPVLKDVDLEIKNKSKIAVVGLSGGGKTTLARLLLGLWVPERGSIKINGRNIEELDKRVLRQKIAYVSQNVELFSGTVSENVKLGNRLATDAWLREVCASAGCGGFIDKLPLKHGSYLEEAGLNLSGGERQRLALARAIIKNPEILILDEATSNLDFMSESTVYDTIFSLDCTVIIIAHRLSTIRRCDEILVIDSASVSERGSHLELLSRGSLYKKIWESQIGRDTPPASAPSKKAEKLSASPPAAQAGDREISYK